MKKLMILFAAGVMAMIPVTASAARVFVGGGGYGFGPYWGGPGYWGGGYPAYTYASTGDIKIDTKVNDAEVFVDGAFAGTVKDAKTLHLRPGSYAIEVRHAGQEALNEKVYVIAGKTLHLHPSL
jgi:hypothetical protein